MDRLRAIETFINVAELGSFNRVAVLQGSTPQAVSKAIRQLEHELGLRLFYRTTRSNKLTEEGRQFLDRVKPGVEAVASAWTEVREASREDSGLIRITAPPLVGRKVLLPLISAFRESYPRVEFDLLLENQYTDIVAGGIDVGFRMGFAPEAQLVVRELFRLQLIVCAAPAYLRKHGIPRSRADLHDHTCTGSRMPNIGRIEPWEFLVDGELVFENIPSRFCTNDIETEMQVVVDGWGIGLIDSLNAAALLRDGRLVPLLIKHVSERYGLFLYYAQRRDMPKRVRNFIDFAHESLQGGREFRFAASELAALHKKVAAKVGSIRR